MERSTVAAAQAAADDESIGAVAVLAVSGDEVVGGNEVRVLESVIGVEDLDAEDFNLLGDTIGLGANGASAVGAVAEVIDVGARDEALDLVGTAFKFLL